MQYILKLIQGASKLKLIFSKIIVYHVKLSENCFYV